MRRRTRFFLCFIGLCLLFLACERRGQRRIVCDTLEQSQSSILSFIQDVAQVIEASEDTAVVLTLVSDAFLRDASKIEQCTQVIDLQLRSMTAEALRQYHEDFIAREEVLTLLDAQDGFQERASADEIEQLAELLSKVFVFSE